MSNLCLREMQEFIGVISCSSQAGWKTREINENKTGLRIRYREMHQDNKN